MKRRCPNHWTKGTKKLFWIYRHVSMGFEGGSENRSGSFSFYTKFDDFLCVHVGDFWCEFGGSSPGSPTYPVTHQPRPFLSPIIKPPVPFLCLSSPLNRISQAPCFLKKKTKKENWGVRLKWRRPMLKVERKYVKVTKSLSRTRNSKERGNRSIFSSY